VELQIPGLSEPRGVPRQTVKVTATFDVFLASEDVDGESADTDGSVE
jgi:hypothetical protein